MLPRVSEPVMKRWMGDVRPDRRERVRGILCAAAFAGLICLAALAELAAAAPAGDFRANIHEYTLDNGLRVILVERRHAPVVHINMMFLAGSVDEPPGLSGIAHMVEHMAGVGTATFGSYDLEKELQLLEELEDVVQALREAERAVQAGEDRAAEVEALKARFAEVKAQADALSVPAALPIVLMANGAVGLNAFTSYDVTGYVASLPKNRFELWARLVADGMYTSVFRHFYNEIEAVKAERRLRIENDPVRLLHEAFLAEAFKVHPYGRSAFGTMEEINSYTARAGRAFWDAHYVPNNAVLAVAGDIDVEATLAIIEKYFGVLERREVKRREIPAEPPQQGERRITLTMGDQSRIIIGYHKPTYPHRDAYVLDVIDAILSSGPTSRLVVRMVNEERIAASVAASSVYPSELAVRYPNLFILTGTPVFPHGPEDLERAFSEEIDRLKMELVDEKTLQRVKNKVRADFIFGLRSDAELLKKLALHELVLGGWEQLFAYPEIVDSVTAEEIRDVARRYFTEENRTVAILVPQRGEAE